jgi:hypothetical protein
MYDLCLKRLSRKAQARAEVKAKEKTRPAAAGDRESEGEGDPDPDPHCLIQRVLLSAEAMPALRYFISTYCPQELQLSLSTSYCASSAAAEGVRATAGGRACSWRLLMQKKLPCSTDSYMFYVYERVVAVVVPPHDGQMS